MVDWDEFMEKLEEEKRQEELRFRQGMREMASVLVEFYRALREAGMSFIEGSFSCASLYFLFLHHSQMEAENGVEEEGEEEDVDE